MQKANWKSGFTIIEILLVMGIFLMFLGFISINLINREPQASLELNTTSIIADIKNQQLQAMTGENAGGDQSDFGVYFDSDSYTLFSGSSYVPGETGNVVVNLPDNLSFSATDFPSSTIVFNRLEGDIKNFSAGADSFTVTNSVSGKSETVIFNRLGTAVNLNES